LHYQLKQAAAGRSVSEEMRARLEWSFLDDWTNDPPTKELRDAISMLAKNVAPYFGRWHENPYAFDVFKVAVDTVLTKMRPRGAPTPPADDGSFRPGTPPKQPAGRSPRAKSLQGGYDGSS
jgi:hypothetical protein